MSAKFFFFSFAFVWEKKRIIPCHCFNEAMPLINAKEKRRKIDDVHSLWTVKMVKSNDFRLYELWCDNFYRFRICQITRVKCVCVNDFAIHRNSTFHWWRKIRRRSRRRRIDESFRYWISCLLLFMRTSIITVEFREKKCFCLPIVWESKPNRINKLMLLLALFVCILIRIKDIKTNFGEMQNTRSVTINSVRQWRQY